MLRLGLDLDGEIKRQTQTISNLELLSSRGECIFKNIKIIFHLDPNTLEKMFSTQELNKFLT